MPDGNFKYNKKCKDEHDDHIFPLSLGGSNAAINHQLISSTENLKKSNDITHFISVDKINPELLSSRYRILLTHANDLNELKILLKTQIHNEITDRMKFNDQELYDTYKSYNETNNLRRDVNRSVKKFREFCNVRNI